MFGILPASRKKEEYSRGDLDPAVATYYSRNYDKEGKIWSDRKEIVDWDADWFVPEGGELEMEVDLLNWRIKWTNGGKVVTTELSPAFKQEAHYYIYVMMDEAGDCI